MKTFVLFFLLISVTFTGLIDYRGLHGQTIEWTWARSAGAEHYDQGTQIAADASGHIYACGMFRSNSITFDPFTLTKAGQRDLYLVQYNLAGQVQWALSEGGSGFEWPRAMTIDKQGNIILAGMFLSPVLTFGDFTLVNKGEDDIFLVKYTPHGDVVWAVSAGGAGYDYAEEVVTDESGNIYMAGSFNGPAITFDETVFYGYSGDFDIYLVKYTPDGKLLWGNIAGGDGDDRAYGMDMDNDNDVYITGMFHSETVHFNSTTLNKKGWYDMFTACYSDQGELNWAVRAGESNNTYGKQLKFLGDYLYVAGEFNGATLQFDDISLANAGDWDIFLVKYTKDGQPDQAVSNGLGTDESVNDLTVIHGNQVALVGYTHNPATESLDILIGFYQETLQMSDQILLGGSGEDVANGVNSNNGELYLTGFFSSDRIVFGDEELTNHGLEDVFIASTTTGNDIKDVPSVLPGITVYPNPCSGAARMRYQISDIGYLILDLYSIAGLRIKRLVNEKKMPGTYDMEVDLRGLPAGIYFCVLKTNDGIQTSKLVKFADD